ncbi:MAG: alpha/beta hydrolase [Caulobacterales bacterium 32-69-10]|nr:MAG: alpha/beta hydrolase [Caulobacterales bacterium 32-69-10]
MNSDHIWRGWNSLDGLALQVRDYAGKEGPLRLPVVLLHGLTRSSADFEVLAPWIAAKGRRVLAPDFRGRGRSAWDPQPMNYVPSTYAADVLALLDAAGVGRAVFVGTSLGGIVTMALAAMRPLAVAAAVLNDVGPSLAPEGLARIGGYAGGDPKARTWADAAAYARSINEAAFPAYDAAQWDAFARRLFEKGPGGELRLAYDPDISAPIKAAGPGALAPDITPLFVALATGRPMLLVRGGISDLIDPERVAQMQMMAPHMAVAEVPGVGHAPMLDEPEALAALGEFLDEAP